MSEQPIDGAGMNGPTPPLADAAERAEYLLAGEALLSDDGRITGTPQAKTVAIQALAQRMRASTPELVLAAMGLVVGNDMAARLGDERYVLAPHNQQYPSLGADVLHVDELDPANPRHAADSVVPMGSTGADTLIRMIAVSELMGSWAYGSNNNVRVLALQEAAREEFGLDGVLDWTLEPKVAFAVALELDYNRGALRDFLRTQYDMTQDVLRARGVTHVLSYRALSWREGAQQPSWANERFLSQDVEARARPLASWSADRQIVADWLEQRGAGGVVLAKHTPARDILALPATGIGYFGQKEWVLLPGDHRAVLDGVFTPEPGAAPRETTNASAVSLGAPVLQTPAAHEPNPAPTASNEAAAPARWRPPAISQPLDPAHPVDRQIQRVLDGTEEPPEWWPRDDSGYVISHRDLDFLGIAPIQIRWLLTGEAPMGMTPALYQQFGTEMLEAIAQDGIDPSYVDIRLKGTGGQFFSGLHKTLPSEEDLASRPEAARRMSQWLGDSPQRPLRRPYDAMWRLGLEPEPSDFDLDINSTAIVRAARENWRAAHPDRYPGDFMRGHGYLDEQALLGAVPTLAAWGQRWEEKLGRPISLGVFESSGPFDATVLGRALSSHFKEDDWIIHRPDTPMAWQTPRSRLPGSLGPASSSPPQPTSAAARSRSTTTSKRPGPSTQPSKTDPGRLGRPHRPEGPETGRGRGR
ncbi:hypothetical protein [Streptomyces sp. NPDC050848]|uniref:hypothetical protein n=1 Tax=Streptomyces sp. NPDC050848 TaxID=3155791 RepID=UPI0033FC9D6B